MGCMHLQENTGRIAQTSRLEKATEDHEAYVAAHPYDIFQANDGYGEAGNRAASLMGKQSKEFICRIGNRCEGCPAATR